MVFFGKNLSPYAGICASITNWFLPGLAVSCKLGPNICPKNSKFHQLNPFKPSSLSFLAYTKDAACVSRSLCMLYLLHVGDMSHRLLKNHPVSSSVFHAGHLFTRLLHFLPKLHPNSHSVFFFHVTISNYSAFFPMSLILSKSICPYYFFINLISGELNLIFS